MKRIGNFINGKIIIKTKKWGITRQTHVGLNLKYLQALIEFAKSARDEILELKQRNKKLQAIVDKYSS